MAIKIILADTSILIDLFRKSDKTNSRFVHLALQGFQFQISAITEYEVYSGTTTAQLPFWDDLLKKILTRQLVLVALYKLNICVNV